MHENISCFSSERIFFEVLDNYVPVNRKFPVANNVPSPSKQLKKTIMCRYLQECLRVKLLP